METLTFGEFRDQLRHSILHSGQKIIGNLPLLLQKKTETGDPSRNTYPMFYLNKAAGDKNMYLYLKKTGFSYSITAAQFLTVVENYHDQQPETDSLPLLMMIENVVENHITYEGCRVKFQTPFCTYELGRTSTTIIFELV